MARHGHTIPVFATSVREVKNRIPEIKDKIIKAAILDCRMPLPKDGWETAKMIKAEVRRLVFTIAEIAEEIDKAYQQS